MEKKIQQYLEGELSNEEQRELLHWLQTGNNQSVFDSVKTDWPFRSQPCTNQAW